MGKGYKARDKTDNDRLEGRGKREKVKDAVNS
jgi:hypothetical protein